MKTCSGNTWKLKGLVRLAVIGIVSVSGLALGSDAASHAETNRLNAERPTTIVFIGDSLTQGYGVRAEEAFPELVGKILRERGYSVKTINGGISGSVTAEADRRLRWYLRADPQIVVLALGANDGMKGTPPEVIENNLRKAIELAKSHNLRIVLAGLKMFTNLGPAYVRKFDAIYPRLAREFQIPLIPFLLEDVALQKEYNQTDMRHPNAKGHELIAARVVIVLEKILKDLSKEKK